MPFNKQTAREAGKKSKRGPSRKLEPNIKDKMELLYEEMLDHLLMHQKELSMSDRVKLVQSLSNYLLPKAKTVRDKFTLEELQEREHMSWAEKTPDPTK